MDHTTLPRVLTVMTGTFLFAATITLSTGCAPLLVGGAIAGGAVVATDRRSVGMQLEDEAIERRIRVALSERYKDRIHINPTSYNGKVLLAGEAPNADIAQDVEAIAAHTQSVRSVVNAVYVGKLSTVGNRLNDTTLLAKVRAALIDERQVPAGAIKVTVERGVAYLMGRVTEAEGDAAARTASRVSGLVRVVKVFEYMSDDERRAINTQSGRPESPRQP